MTRSFRGGPLALTPLADAAPAVAQVTVGGAPMYATKDIAGDAVNSRDHTTPVAAVKAAGLVDTLEGPGPFTAFAPTDAAFDMLPKGTVETLVKPGNKPAPTKVLTHHVVPGKLDAATLKRMVRDGRGQATPKTVQGETLTVTLQDDAIMVRDQKGGTARVSTPDVPQSNGVIHVTDKVLLPA